MSKKRSFIIFGIVTILLIALVLSSTIFRVRKNNVIFSGDVTAFSADDVSNACGIKKGKSVFLINKSLAKENVEKAVPYAKVESVYVTFPNTLNFVVSQRKDFCFINQNGTYLVCDRSLKVLRTSSELPELVCVGAEVNNLQAGDVAVLGAVSKIFAFFGETISIKIDNVQSSEFNLSEEALRSALEKIELKSDGNLVEITFKQGFKVKFSAENAIDEKSFYLMGIIYGNGASILSDEEKESGKTFVLEKVGDEMRKIPEE